MTSRLSFVVALVCMIAMLCSVFGAQAMQCPNRDEMFVQHHPRTHCRCISGFYLQKTNSCHSVCPDGFEGQREATVQTPAATVAGVCVEVEQPLPPRPATCPAGQFLNEDTNLCQRCPPGTFKKNAGLTTGCQACPTNNWSSSGATECEVCLTHWTTGTIQYPIQVGDGRCKCQEESSYSAYNYKVTATQGGFDIQQRKCVLSCPSGTELQRRCVGNLCNLCISCPANTYSYVSNFDDGKTKSHRNTGCMPCPAGQRAAPGSSACQDVPMSCPPGTRLDRPNLQCLACPDGTYSSQTNSAQCTKCPAGTKTNKAKSACIPDEGDVPFGMFDIMMG